MQPSSPSHWLQDVAGHAGLDLDIPPRLDLLKPVAVDRLQARIRAVLRRTGVRIAPMLADGVENETG